MQVSHCQERAPGSRRSPRPKGAECSWVEPLLSQAVRRLSILRVGIQPEEPFSRSAADCRFSQTSLHPPRAWMPMRQCACAVHQDPMVNSALLLSPSPHHLLLIQWDNASLSAVTGWIATVRGGTGGSRSCITTAAERECLVEGLTPNMRYRVTLRAYRVPTGPGEESPSVSVTTRR